MIKWFGAVLLISLLALCCTGPVGPPGLPGDEGLTDPSIQPEIVYSFPSNNSQGPYPDYNSRVAIRFDKIMDHESMKNAVTLSSSAGDVKFDTSTVGQNSDAFSLGGMDPRGRSFTFRWKLGQSYTLTIDSTAVDVNGNHFHHPFSTTFTPEPYFRVMSISPVNASSEVPVSSTISLSFNNVVDTTIFSKIHISPALTGAWTFSPAFPAPDSTVLRFSFTNASIDTTYTVTVDQTARDKNGDQMHQGFSSTFTTATFRLISTNPTDGSSNISVSSSVSVNFSIPIDTSTVRQAFSIAPNVPGIFSLADGSSSFTFRPVKRLQENTSYTITVSTSMGAKGGVHLAAPYSFTFTTGTFAVTSSSPSNGNTGVSLPASMSISFSDLIDTGSVRQAFSTSPNVAGSFQLVDSTSSFVFNPSSRLQANTVYTVTLSTAMASRSGVHLAQPYIFSFTTTAFMLTGTSPSHGSTNVSLNGRITVSLSDYVDTASVRSAFSISPPLPGVLNVFDNTASFSFIPINGFSSNTSYTVTLSPLLRSKGGSNLPEPYTFTFITQPFSVTSTNPSNGNTNVNYTGISVSCNGFIDGGSIDSAFSISPNITGTFQYRQGDTYFYFYPDQPYASNTTYTVTVSTALHDRVGDHLSTAYHFAFTTIPFSVGTTNPQDGSIDVPIDQAIQINFTAPIDTAGITSAVTFNPPINTIISANEGSSSIIYYPIDALELNTRYTVSVSTGVKALTGENLSLPYTFSFKTIPFEVTYSTPTEGQINVPRSTIIALTFSAPIDTGTIRTAFSINPPVAGTLNSYDGTTYFTFEPNADLDANTEYTVSVSMALKSKNGTPLGAPFSFSFVTGN